MKKLIFITLAVILLGCTANTKYAGAKRQKRNVHQKYTTKISKAQVKKSIGNAKKLNVKKGEKLSFVCSFYAEKFQGRLTSNGERYDKHKLTAAHKTLPFNTKLKVTNPDNGKFVIVRVNDRGPFVKGRDLDLSYAAAKKIGLIPHGVKRMDIEVIKVGD
jgi:rare lipoprotein A